MVRSSLFPSFFPQLCLRLHATHQVAKGPSENSFLFENDARQNACEIITENEC